MAKYYNQALSQEGARKFEIVLVGYDRDSTAHQKYMKKSKIPFPAIKMASKEALTKLTDIGAEQWIPNAALLTKDGKLITNKRDKVFAKLAEWSKPASE